MIGTTKGSAGAGSLWPAAQWISVLAAVSVVVLLVARPEAGLYLTWYVLIPMVPALLLVAPGVWRNLCPIAVVHQLPRLSRLGGARRLRVSSQWWAPAIAAAALFAIVPLRHPILNQDGRALAAFVVSVLVVALVGGLVLAGKSGWCSTYCPVGPVERLYGQEPFLQVRHAHCAVCLGCTDPCFDREGPSAVQRMAGVDPVARSEPPGAAPLWKTPTGAFAAAFPGFILGYFTVDPASAIPALYLHVLLYSAGSFALLGAVQALPGIGAGWGLRLSAAAAAGVYYWFTVPAVIAAAEANWLAAPAPPWAVVAGRALFLGLAVVWLLDSPRRALRGVPGNSAPTPLRLDRT